MASPKKRRTYTDEDFYDRLFSDGIGSSDDDEDEDE